MKKYIAILGLLVLVACERGTPPLPAAKVAESTSYGDYVIVEDVYDCYEYVNGKDTPVTCPSTKPG